MPESRRANVHLVPVTSHVDRVADARARLYGVQLGAIVDAWDQCEQTAHDLHDFRADLRKLAARMQDISTAAAGSSVEDGRRLPQEVMVDE